MEVTEHNSKTSYGGFSAWFLSTLASVWKSPVAERDSRLGEINTDEYEKNYTVEQFHLRVVNASPLGNAFPALLGKEILELGCSHGGVSCWLASLGAKRVVGIDINTTNFHHGIDLANSFPSPLPVELVKMNAMDLEFPENSFDFVYADNAFEHYSDPGKVMLEAYRVLRPGGKLIVPIFSSIFSKHGLHLKLGLKMPWANLFFSEKTICEAMQRQAIKRSELFEWYEGLKNNPVRVRDIRRYSDLNDITYKAFKVIAKRTGFEIETFNIYSTRMGRIINKLPLIKESKLSDVLSTGAGAILRK